MEINIEKLQTKGRPPKAEAKRKRLHYSVWVSQEEKAKIDTLCQQAGLAASQFFLQQVLDKPIKTQRKKTWPPSVEPYMLGISKIAGLLSLLAIKTKDRDIQQSRNWQQSSECIKWLHFLIILRVFEDFEFPQLNLNLKAINEKSLLLYWQLNQSPDFEGKVELLAATEKINSLAGHLLSSFEKHYHDTTTPKTFQNLWAADTDIHQEIKKIKNELIRL